jgi:hypothetical protein
MMPGGRKPGDASLSRLEIVIKGDHLNPEIAWYQLEKQAAMQDAFVKIEGTIKTTTQLASVGFFIGSIFIPGPEDVVMAALFSRHGIRAVREAGEWAFYKGNTRLAGEARDEAVEQATKIADEFSHPNYVDGLPFAYKDKAFRLWVSRFDDEFKAAGFGDSIFFMQGSAASGIKYSSQQLLDARKGIRPSDYDIAIVSPSIVKRAEELGLDIFSGELSAHDIAALGLSQAQDILSRASKGGITVNFKIYKTIEDVYEYGSTIPFAPFGR